MQTVTWSTFYGSFFLLFSAHCLLDPQSRAPPCFTKRVWLVSVLKPNSSEMLLDFGKAIACDTIIIAFSGLH